jgi:hypothetical protein
VSQKRATPHSGQLSTTANEQKHVFGLLENRTQDLHDSNSMAHSAYP